MVWIYFDASALVKRYSSEDGTELVNEAFSIASVDDELILSALDSIAQHNINATDAVILRSW